MAPRFQLFSEENLAKLRQKPILVAYCAALLLNNGFRKICSRICDRGLFIMDEVISDFGFGGTEKRQKQSARRLISILKLPHYDVSTDFIQGKTRHEGQEILNPMGRTQVRHGTRSLLLEPTDLTSAFLLSGNRRAAKVGVGLAILHSFVLEEVTESERERMHEMNADLQEQISQVSVTFIYPIP